MDYGFLVTLAIIITGIRDVPACDCQKSLSFWSPWLLLLLGVTTGVQLYFSSDMCWSVTADEFQDDEGICWRLTLALFYQSLYWFLVLEEQSNDCSMWVTAPIDFA